MALEVVMSMNAVATYKSICQSLADYDVDAALALDKAIYEKLDQLAELPYLGAIYEEKGEPSPFREVQVGKYRLFYEVKENRRRINIVLLWHSSRDEPTLYDLRGR